MSIRRQKFINDNLTELQYYHNAISDKVRGIQGFGPKTPKTCFEAVLIEKNNFYLPACFLNIFWDFNETKDQNFILNSLKSLSQANENEELPDPIMSYVYAYCLQRTNAVDESQDILSKLSNQCFPPALATMGDACIVHHDIKNGLSWYSHAIAHDYMAVTPRHNRIVLKDAPFIKNIPLRILLVANVAYRAIQLIKRGMKGEHLLYLDFYGIKYHLNEYAKIPKAKRIEMLNSP